ncbi:MAG: MATE family efflux transporter, partial [Lachnospiraceae bacterium]|nr:MATE family efflux transporter [Lachnospiraceae bacterium]
FGMAGMMTGALLNIGGDYLFMFKLNMGIAGAGLSTAISQVVSFIILLAAFLTHKTQCTLSLKLVYLDYRQIFNIMATGFPSLLRQALNSISTIILNTEARAYGDSAVAAMSIVSRVGFFVFAVAIGIGQGFQPVSAFNYGAGKHDRVRKAFFTTVVLSELTMLVFSIFVFFNAGDIVWRFREDMEVVKVGTRALQLYVLAQVTLPPSMSCEMLYQSTGRRLGATILSAMRSGIFFIPALLILSRIRGLAGIQEAQPLAFLLSFPVSIIFIIVYFKKYGEKAQIARQERALR